ncbi:MAG: hypothetical protein NWF08_05905 [Candidatus Bathyarchaeota archaeon]|nr:hypothetical protein [Candidatus Bathyarchaeota archaeon]
MKSWKIGAIAGLIAGIIASILASIFNILTLNFGLGWGYPNEIESHLLIIPIWGIIFGIIYSRTYSIIPNRGIFKGIIFGLFVFLITNFRDASFLLPFGIFLLLSIGWMIVGFFQSITYGSILSILYQNLCSKYKIPKRAPKIKTYNVSRGIYLGAIAGLIGGVAAFLSRVGITITGLYPLPVELDPSSLFNVLAGYHIILNTIWAIVLGAIYTKVYNLVPGTGLIKGVFYGLIFFLVASFRMIPYFTLWGDLVNGLGWGYVGFFNALYFGILIGILYRK